MSEFAEVSEAPETLGEPSEPRGEMGVVNKYFGADAQTERANETWQQGFNDGAEMASEVYNQDDGDDDYSESEPELDLASMTRAELQEAWDSGEVSEEQLAEFGREQIAEDMAPFHEQMAEFQELRQQRSQAQQEQYFQTQALGAQVAADIVQQAHRDSKAGLLNQERTLPVALQTAAELSQELRDAGYPEDEIVGNTQMIVRAASLLAAQETHRRNIGLRAMGRRTDTGEFDR